MPVNLETLPKTMHDLPIDDRGYPVPWFVQWVDGKPEFRAMDGQKLSRAISEKRCWVCGEKRGVYSTFVVGPMCGINRISSEPPSHNECAKWSVVNCPFLSNPRMVRREDDVVNNAHLVENSAGQAIARNPGVTLLWTTRQFEILKVPNGILFQMGEPESVAWYANGRTASRTEVVESVRTGLPNLQLLAQQQDEETPGNMRLAMMQLKKSCDYFARFLPANQFTSYDDVPLM